jgi:hypothetical protein
MADIAEGFWPCKVIDGTYGDNDKGIPVVRINAEVTDGTHKGRRFTYDEIVNNKQAPYIAKTCKAVGWACRDLATLESDIAAWVAKTGGASTLEIKHWERKTGPKAGTTWVKVNSIGRGPRPLKASSAENRADANAALLAALADDQSGGGGPPPDDIPPAGDEDIPFITSSMAYDRAVRRW